MPPVTILGIESSCDETAAAVVRDGRVILGGVVASQTDLHARFGGVVPEAASRAHVAAIVPVVQETLDRAGVGRGGIDAVAVSNEPGLVGSLLVGIAFAKAFALALGKPLVGVNHLHAHLYAAALNAELQFPLVGAVISGGHTAIFHSTDELTHTLIGSTIDDAAGEAFDKVANILGLGYPGGPVIDRLAREGDPKRFRFPRTFIKSDDLRFSFSGIKTAVLYHVQGHSSGKAGRRDLDQQEIRDIAAGFQEAVVDVLVAKIGKAARARHAGMVVAGGGVACNSRFRERLAAACACPVVIPPPALCIDNGAMIAGLGYHLFKRGIVAGMELDARPQLVRMARV
ncbi:MAG: tRNA (adenosine(37)-N6)-threonylcarbamoyltransferase complex transferase subunit TsaD [Planctomycetota bacterium]